MARRRGSAGATFGMYYIFFKALGTVVSGVSIAFGWTAGRLVRAQRRRQRRRLAAAAETADHALERT